MKNFTKNLIITALSIFAIISFIRFDVYVWQWSESGRAAYLFAVIVISFIATAIEESVPNK